MANKLTILFSPLDSYGHINACLGVAQILRKRGHRVVFMVDSKCSGSLIKEGFEVKVHKSPQLEDNDEDFWLNYVKENAHVLRLSPIEKVTAFSLPTTRITAQMHMDRELQYKQIINNIKPDLIIIDNYVCSPAMTNSGIPWVWLVSANPLVAILDSDTPPGGSGLSTNGPKQDFDEYAHKKAEILKPLWDYVNEWVIREGAPELPKNQLHPYSPFLNLYMYPEEIDYIRLRPLPSKWFRCDTFVRSSDENFQIPELLKGKSGKLIYVSMGSFACGDIDLMKRLVSMLSESPDRFIVSKGALSDQYELADNMWGAASVPQTKVLPLVDLVITHGGNNTVTETFYYGKPMIVMPLFFDQYDNAQRIHDTGYGIRLDPYNCTKEQLLNSIEKLLNDNELKIKLKVTSQRIQSSQSIEKAADLIEKIIIN